VIHWFFFLCCRQLQRGTLFSPFWPQSLQSVVISLFKLNLNVPACCGAIEERLTWYRRVEPSRCINEWAVDYFSFSSSICVEMCGDVELLLNDYAYGWALLAPRTWQFQIWCGGRSGVAAVRVFSRSWNMYAYLVKSMSWELRS
jgi:hypothetical protein